MKQLCYYGNPILRKKCKPVQEITPFIHQVIKQMLETLKFHNGAGIAAPQIGYELQIFINLLSDQEDEDGFALDLTQPEIYINPIITNSSKKQFKDKEGCLSIPGIRSDVSRPQSINIEYTDIDGKRVTCKNIKGWKAKCLQHEMDHLNGVLFIDHISKEDKMKAQPILMDLEHNYRKNSIMPKDFL
jgi:peptide deformylase